MRTGAVLVVACMHLISGKDLTPEYKGCYSTSFVNQHAQYYKFNQSMNIEQGYAACNNRLTCYIGLQVDERLTASNFVYCGNYLPEVSPKLDNSQCYTCQENATIGCGGTNSMSVYMLRESTPLAVLLKTERGVELLGDNVTKLIVPYRDSPPSERFRPYHSVNYIYTEDLILFFIYTQIMRSVYDNDQMHYTKPTEILYQGYHCRFAVDFIMNYIYFDGLVNELFRTDTHGLSTSIVSHFGHDLRHIKIDPFNRSITFTKLPHDSICIWLFDEQRLVIHTVKNFHIEKIRALSMDIQEVYLYAIVKMTYSSITHLVRFDYDIFGMELLFRGLELDNAIVIEVFRDTAVWLTTDGGVSVLYTCKLTPSCLESLTTYSSNQTIYDFTIYHPEKQTPGKRRLCANMTCSHICQNASLFTARCTCPPGMELGPDNSTCNEKPTTTTMSTTASLTTSTTVPPTTSTTTSTIASTTASTTMSTTQASTFADYDKSPVTFLDHLATEIISTSHSGTITPKNDKSSSCENIFELYTHVIYIMIIFFLLICMGFITIKVYKKGHYSPPDREQLELRSI